MSLVHAIDELRIQDERLHGDSQTTIVASDSAASNGNFPVQGLFRFRPTCLECFTRELQPKCVQDAAPPGTKMAADSRKQTVHLVVRLQVLQDAVWCNDEIEGPVQVKIGDISELNLGLARAG